MKNSRFFHPATLFFLLSLLAGFLSWIGSIYDWGDVQSLISAEGLRWKLRNAEEEYRDAPMLGTWLVLFLGLGICVHSGLWRAFARLLVGRRRFSRKEKRALTLATAVALLYGAAFSLLTWGPWPVVRSVTGGLDGSPLAAGAGYVLSLGVGMVSVVYGYASDVYRSDRDIVKGMSYGFVRLAEYFVILFFVVQLFASLEYTRLLQCAGVSEQVLGWIYKACCLLALFYCAARRPTAGKNKYS